MWAREWMNTCNRLSTESRIWWKKRFFFFFFHKKKKKETKEKQNNNFLSLFIPNSVSLQILHPKAGVKELITIVLFGSRETKNQFSHMGYNRIFVLQEPAIADVNTLKLLQQVTPGEQEGDCKQEAFFFVFFLFFFLFFSFNLPKLLSMP
jgi:hypothetical protein